MAEGLVFDDLRIRMSPARQLRLATMVGPGETLTVMGPSGSGKSTLLAAIIGTLPREFAMQGRILLDGQEITSLPSDRRGVGILFQDDLLFPHMSVGANLAFGLAQRLRGRRERRARVMQALDEIGLSGFHDRDPATLSGGQKARVALMRMLLSEPRALLLDEAFSKLDPALRVQMRLLVFERARALGLPVLMVTHDAEDARAAGGTILDMERDVVMVRQAGSHIP
jgi:putative thiamine transport system ATP-binding protein